MNRHLPGKFLWDVKLRMTEKGGSRYELFNFYHCHCFHQFHRYYHCVHHQIKKITIIVFIDAIITVAITILAAQVDISGTLST